MGKLKETPGIGQGMWNGKTSAELVDSKYYEKLSICGNISYISGYDPFNSLTQNHVPYFSQSSKVGNETWCHIILVA